MPEHAENVGIILSKQLDEGGFREGSVFIWGQWTSRSDIKLEGFGWIFKLVFWCLRYLMSNSCMDLVCLSTTPCVTLGTNS